MKHLRVPVVASLVTLALAVGCGTPEPVTPADVPTVDAATATDAAQVSDTAVADDGLVVRDAPSADVPAVEDAPRATDVPAVEDTPRATDVPVVEDAPTGADAPPLHDVVAPMDVAITPDVPRADVVAPMDVVTAPDVPRADVVDAAFDAGPPPSPRVTLRNAAASFSQTSYGVEEAINGVVPTQSANDGWAVSNNGATGAQSAVFEFADDSPGYSNGTELTVTLHFSSLPAYHLGAFALSVTTAPRDTFADGMSSNGQLGAPAQWTRLAPVLAQTTAGTLTVRPDGSVLAANTGVGSVRYTLTLRTPLTRITGIRLDALEDSALPTNGPGTQTDGNFVLSELQVDQRAPAAPAPVALAMNTAAATFSQNGYAVARAFDGSNAGAGWAIERDNGSTSPETAAVEFAADTYPYPGGTHVEVTLVQLLGTSHRLGRFRLAVTNAPRSAFADGLSTNGNVGAPEIWSLARIEAATSDNGITLTPQSDGSVLPSGTASSATYTVRFTTPLRGLTGIRLEALETPGLPTNGPGASSSGNFSLSECRVAVGPVPSS